MKALAYSIVQYQSGTRARGHFSEAFIIYYARKAGVKCRLHDLRHTFATYMINLDVSIKTLQALLGHEDISSTMIYADTMEESKKRAIEMLNYNLDNK